MKLEFVSAGERHRVDAPDGRTLAELAFEVGLPLNTACGGNGICERCGVLLRRGRFQVDGQAVEGSTSEAVSALACRTRLVEGPALVEVPASSRIVEKAQIHDDFVLPPFELNPATRARTVRVPPASLEAPDGDAERLRRALSDGGPPPKVPLPLLRELPELLARGGGRVTATVGPYRGTPSLLRLDPGAVDGRVLAAAVDVGTTTVVCALVNLASGRILARAAAYNQQVRKADDVGSRISYCRSREDRERMQRLVVEETINPLIHRVCARVGAAPADLVRVAVAGNTVMMHLLLGLPPDGIGVLPFHPVVAHHPGYGAREIGLDVGAAAVLDVLPSISGYVGGDITADIHAARLLERRGLHLLVDIGTNGEMVLWDGKRLRAAATAAGPAFEGAGIRHGCRAAEGAIEHVRCGGAFDLRLEVIGQVAPTGLCGSAIVDLIAEAFRCGILGPTGRFDVEALRRAGRYAAIPTDGATAHACVVASAEASGADEALWLSEGDVAEVLKAKAAVYAGMKTLLHACERRFEELDSLILAGGFARHLDARRAAWIGLLPDLPPEKVEIVGNGSLAGAYLSLVDAGAAAKYDAIASRAEVLELNLTEDFETNFVDALLLPNMNEEAFPRALKEMRTG